MSLELKQVIILRKDLKMGKGKAAAQAAHASVSAAIYCYNQKRDIFMKWWSIGQKKVILGVDSIKELDQIEKELKKLGMIIARIDDAGRTQLPPGTTTALGVQPQNSKEVEKITSKLKLF